MRLVLKVEHAFLGHVSIKKKYLPVCWSSANVEMTKPPKFVQTRSC